MTVLPSIANRMALSGNADLFRGTARGENADILFEALLKGFGKELKPQEDGQSAIHPAIGQSADSFLSGALPVSTSLPLASIVDKVRNIFDQGIETITPASIPSQAVRLLTRISETLGNWAGPFSSTVVSSSLGSETITSAGHVALQTAYAPAGHPTVLNIRLSRQPEAIKSPIASLRLPCRPNVDPATKPTTGAVTAHLFDLEGQLRVVVKLPKLLEDQRLELEARLRELLEEFGHHRPDLVIREMGRAANG